MATTVAERKLFVAGEWIETGDWIEERSPYSGEVGGRVAKGGADETKRALDAHEQGRGEPPLAHKRARRRAQAPRGRARAHDTRRPHEADETCARRGVARDVHVCVRRGRGAQAPRR